MASLLGWRTEARANPEVKAAVADAHHLRDLYGHRAEAWCKAALQALPHGDERRQSIRRIIRALHAVPVVGSPQNGIRLPM